MKYFSFTGRSWKCAVLAAVFCGSMSVQAIDPPEPFGAVPSARQLNWHRTSEVYGMLNFSTITFVGKEWGYGDESPKLFNPTDFNALQIIRAAKSAGITALVLDAKHHGGFCLWPSKYNKHYSVRNSPWKKGKGDMIRELVDACRQEGIKVGFYLSPWDRNHKDYGTEKYLTYYKNQLRELLTNYGEVSIIWLDGANGGDGYYGGANETRKVNSREYYPLKEWHAMIRELQPNAVIFSDCGPDIRWNGNEHGFSAENCWATYADPKWADSNLDKLNKGVEKGDLWMPAEADFPLHLDPKGWFWHPGSKPATVDQLVEIYFNSVGRNSFMDIGIAPDRTGKMCAEDVLALEGFGNRIKSIFATNLAEQATIEASNTRGNDASYSVNNVVNGAHTDKYWATDDEVKDAVITLKFASPVTFSVVDMREYIPLGHRVSDWTIEVEYNNKWYTIGSGRGIGARRLWRGPVTTTRQMRIKFDKAFACPAISEIGVYLEPENN